MSSWRVALDEFCNALQRVEQEMGMELHTQHLQLALGQALVKRQTLNLLALTAYKVGVRMRNSHCSNVCQQDIRKSRVSQIKQSGERSRPPGKRFLEPRW